MATVARVAVNPLHNNVHVMGLIHKRFGLEPGEINHIIEAHRNNYERQRNIKRPMKNVSNIIPRNMRRYYRLNGIGMNEIEREFANIRMNA